MVVVHAGGTHTIAAFAALGVQRLSPLVYAKSVARIGYGSYKVGMCINLLRTSSSFKLFDVPPIAQALRAGHHSNRSYGSCYRPLDAFVTVWAA